ncbi:PUA-like domain-containing protein [Trametes elegans]|nr:PUA-like domain-containing protein [Trametes elegans]
MSYFYRRELFNAGVHAYLRAGIHGRQESGAFSIVMSGGYEDEEDFGERIIYIGTGGRERPENKGPQRWDQTMEHRMNKTMMKSIETRNPVRVVRGCGLRSPYAPDEGWRYDGLYTVQSASMKKGRSGFMVCAFELQVRAPAPYNPASHIASFDVFCR